MSWTTHIAACAAVIAICAEVCASASATSLPTIVGRALVGASSTIVNVSLDVYALATAASLSRAAVSIAGTRALSIVTCTSCRALVMTLPAVIRGDVKVCAYVGATSWAVGVVPSSADIATRAAIIWL